MLLNFFGFYILHDDHTNQGIQFVRPARDDMQCFPFTSICITILCHALCYVYAMLYALALGSAKPSFPWIVG